MNKELYTLCLNADFEKIFKAKGYVYYGSQPYDLNIIGVRNDFTDRVTNKFDDAIVVEYKVPSGSIRRVIYAATTEPGAEYMIHPLSKGSAILVPGQYRSAYTIGLHRGKYQALCQRIPLPVYRDNNKDMIYDMNPNTIEKGIFGINIHRAGRCAESTLVDNWSAGCQVISDPKNFNSFMTLAKLQIKQGLGDKFTYTLLNSSDII